MAARHDVHQPPPPGLPSPKQPSFQKNHLSGGLDAETYQSRCCDSWVKHASKSQKYSTNHPRLSPCSARFPSPPGSPPKHRFNADKWASGLSHKQSMCSTGDPPFIVHKGPPTAVLIFRGWNQWGKKKSLVLENHCLSQGGARHFSSGRMDIEGKWTREQPSPTKSRAHPLLPAAAACEEAIMISPSPQAQLS